MGLLSSTMPTREQALPGRAERMPIPSRHFVNGAPLDGPLGTLQEAVFGMGCFWGAEKGFWPIPGVVSTAVGYAGGYTRNPTYHEVCSGLTGHTEVVRVVFDPATVRYEDLLRVFWEGHDPTQGMRQGSDAGTQYRSAIYHVRRRSSAGPPTPHAMRTRRCSAPRLRHDHDGDRSCSPVLLRRGVPRSRSLAKNPGGYCGHGGLGVSCPIGVAAAR